MAAAHVETVKLPADGWHAREYQEPFWEYMENGGRRAVCVWHRRAGKDQCSVNLCAVKSAERVGSYWHILPTMRLARRVVWENMDKEGRPFLRAFPGYEAPGDSQWVTRKRDDLMKLWLANGSTYELIGADDPGTSVGPNPVGVIFSEFSTTRKMQEMWEYVQPILAENGGWAVFIFTPRGKNHGYQLYDQTKDEDDWFTQVLTVDDTWYTDRFGHRVRSVPEKAMEEVRHSGMSDAKIQQEFYCSWSGPLDSAWYGDLMMRMDEEARIGKFPLIPRCPVDTAFDIGLGDSTAIWFLQHPPGGRPRAIDYYENRGKDWEHYLSHLAGKPYPYRYHLAPHDFKHKTIRSPHGLEAVSRDFGFYFRTAPKLLLRDGIAAVRSLLTHLEIDEEHCERGIQALREYERIQDQKTGEYTDLPVHNWASHGADALRTYALGIPKEMEGSWSKSGPLYQDQAIV